MTEELWQHVLRFLDKYGNTVGDHMEELYEFADKTGILERHKQLMCKPGHSSETDMRIMYYELIKMLIAFEKQNGPSVKGGRNLTDRLQNYLNQRFLEDVEGLKRQKQRTEKISCDNHKISSPEVSHNTSLELRLKTIEDNQRKLQKSNIELKDANNLLMSKLSEAFNSSGQLSEFKASRY